MIIFLSPPLILSIVMASACAALFNIWQGGSARDLLLYLIVGWLGFGVGELAGDFFGLDMLMIGQIHVVEGISFCLLFLLLAKWLKL
jgi:hypothetical protein